VASLRFNYLFAGLLGISFLTAFVLPPSVTTSRLGELQGLFAPVSRPVRALSGLIYRQFHPEPVIDHVSPATPRDPTDVYTENEALRSDYASLLAKFEQLSQLNADRQAVGDIRPLCKPATVTASDPSGIRESLTITATAPASMLMKRPVICGNTSQSLLPCDLVGRVVRSGPLGTQVQLVTDPGSALTARIGRYVPQPDGKVKLVYVDKIHPLIRGVGHNAMTISSNLSMKEVQDAGIAVNDLVLLDDREWPPNIQGFSVGRIVSITRQPKSPLLADIRIEPQTNLMRLTEVMVMVKDGPS